MACSSRGCLEPFAGFLSTDFIQESIPPGSRIHGEIEKIKDEANLVALSIFDPKNRRNLSIGNSNFSAFFSDEEYGKGFTKALSSLIAYLIILNSRSVTPGSAVEQFAVQFQKKAREVFELMALGSNDPAFAALANLRKDMKRLNNERGFYASTALNEETMMSIIPEGIVKTFIEIDAKTGDLIASLDASLPTDLLKAYRIEIGSHLTFEGMKALRIPDTIKRIVIAYKNELISIPQKKIEDIIIEIDSYLTFEVMKALRIPDTIKRIVITCKPIPQKKIEDIIKEREVELFFQNPYVAPRREDNRYALIAYFIIELSDITQIRTELGLPPFDSKPEAMCFPFAVVRNPIISEYTDSYLKDKMEKCAALDPLMELIREKSESKTIDLQ